jgi:hypothetical protein
MSCPTRSIRTYWVRPGLDAASAVLWVAAYGLVDKLWVALAAHSIAACLGMMMIRVDLEAEPEFVWVHATCSLAAAWVWFILAAEAQWPCPPLVMHVLFLIAQIIL